MTYFLALVSVLLAKYELASAYAVFWNTDSVIVHQGAAVNLTCTVPDFEFMDVIRVSFKNHDGQMLTIADNKDVKFPFSNISRFGVEFYIINNKGYITVSYQDIHGEDTGSLLCQKLQDKNNLAEVKLKVQVPVKEIYLKQKTSTGWNKMLATDVIVLRELEDNELECIAVVDGGLTPIMLRATIGTEDKTEFFTANEELKVIKTDKSGLGQYYCEYKLIYSSTIPPQEFNGLWLTCTAVQEGFHNFSTSALLSIEYGPILTCRKYEHHSRLGASVHVVCEVDANPFSHSITWMVDVLGQSAATRRLLTSDNNIHMSETFVNDFRKQVQLTIRTVHRSHFSNYYLSAENEVSLAEVTIVVLPASLELSQLPSSQDQMVSFLRQQLPQTEMGKSYMKTSASRTLSAVSGTLLLAIAVTIQHIRLGSYSVQKVICNCPN